jgi:hypothetical protein
MGIMADIIQQGCTVLEVAVPLLKNFVHMYQENENFVG